MASFVGWRSAIVAALVLILGLGLALARAHIETLNALVLAAGWLAALAVLVRGRLNAQHDRLQKVDAVLEQSSRRAARIRALWHVSSSDALNDAEHVQAVLDAGRIALRVDHPIFGMISQIEGDELVVNAISWSGDADLNLSGVLSVTLCGTGNVAALASNSV